MPQLLFALLLVASLSAAEDPFAQPIGGWPGSVQPGKGSFSKVSVPGLENAGSRAWMAMGIPDGSGGGPMYDPAVAWPLVIVLHGSGGTGDSLASVFRGTLKQMGAISAFPTSLEDNPLLEWNYPHEMAYILQVVQVMARTWHIDPHRVYLIGHSMGGGGTYAVGSQTTPAWAALGPMAGWWQTTGPQASRLRDIPIRILHGVNDSAVPIDQGDAAWSAITGAGNTLSVYDRVAGAGHSDILVKGGSVTSQVFELEQWLLAQRRSQPSDLAAAAVMLDGYGSGFGWKGGRTPIGWWPIDGSQAPDVSGLTVDPTTPQVGQAAVCRVTASDPKYGSQLFARWDFGDGSSSTAWAPTHIWRDPGTYTLRVTIANIEGAEQSLSRQVVVGGAAGSEPTITSAGSASGPSGQPFLYQITASGSPTLYHATGLPVGWYCDPATGQVHAATPADGNRTIRVFAYNGAGSGFRDVAVSIGGVAPPPPPPPPPADSRRIRVTVVPGHAWQCLSLGDAPDDDGDQAVFDGLDPQDAHRLSLVLQLLDPG